MKYIFFIGLVLSFIFALASGAGCGKHEEFKFCEPCTALKCGEEDPKICPRICKNTGCYCEEGYLRNDNGVCVSKNKCPSKCGAHEDYLDCQPCAALNCGEKDPEVCLDICRNPGCYCKKGYLRNEHGVCVRKSRCPTS